MAKRSMFEGWTQEQREALGGRIREVVQAIGTRAEAAEVARVSLRTIEDYMSGKVAPSLLPIGNMALATGFDMQWIVTGQGEKMWPHAKGRPVSREVGLGTLARELIDGWRAAYDATGVRLTDDELEVAVGDVLDAIIESASDGAEWKRLAGFALALERKRLKRR